MIFSPAEKFRPAVVPTPWSLGEAVGRLVEISGSAASATLTIAFTLVREAQQRGEPAGWVTSAKEFFYPPDVERNGIDLNALVVVRLNHTQSIARAGEKLLRSGGFGIIVLDLGGAEIPLPLQTRLTGLANRHHTALVCLTKKSSSAVSLGSLVSLRAHAERKRAEDRRFACVLRVFKDKRRGPTWNYEELYTGPVGLC